MNLSAYLLTFADLYHRDGLVKLDAAFISDLKQKDLALYNRLLAARAEPEALPDKDHSQLLIDMAPALEAFIAGLFGIEKELQELAERHQQLAPLYRCKRLFVQRRAAKALKPEEAARVDGEMLLSMLPIPHTTIETLELSFAKMVMGWLEQEDEHKSLLEMAARYACWALTSDAGKQKHEKGLLFKQPKKLEPEHLIEVESELRDGVTIMRLAKEKQRVRSGFSLTDDAGHLKHALDHAHYCIICHNQGKDSCSKGLREKDGAFKKNALGITLAGCPLEEKISEMNHLKSEALPLAALAVVVVDNPMCAGTGHRICNDCMKSCIYQKQEPVNIPLTETHVLRDILHLPYGFEIYSLLSRWNPLDIKRPLPKPDSGKRVLIAGLGPAGYTLAHHLMNDGHTVVGIDGLKIEPLPELLSGVTADGSRVMFEPIKDVKALYEALDERVLAGFGGVAEYGITVRWDKNYLKIIRLLLERRAEFAMIGGVRFGGTITAEQSWELGFDHIALCMGAGKPTVLDIPNAMARGVRTASDFLMALQLTGAAKKDSIANLQVRLPAVVIGGGLTAIDTATELLAYYPLQVEKFLTRYETLVKAQGEAAVRSGWTKEEQVIAEEFISHAKQIRAEKKKPKPDVWSLLDQWGGVKLVYRRRLIDAPSYRLNHEEVEKAFEEGIFIAENYEPVAVEVDEFGHASSIRIRSSKDEINLPARAILIAAGTSPNTVLAREAPEIFQLDGKYFRAIDSEGRPVSPERVAKPVAPQVLMSIDEEGRAVSFFGDLHPSFAGNVVKAMASAKQGYPVVSSQLARRSRMPDAGCQEFLRHVKDQLRATVHAVNRLTPNIVEVVVHAPLAAKNFQPGQFYRLQNFEANALKLTSTTLAMEGLAMTGAWVDKERGLLATIVLEMGGSSDLCAFLKLGEPVILMGPTGTPTHIPTNENVLLVGGGLGNAVLFSIGKAMRGNGCKVLYFAGYKKAIDRYKIEEIEAAADQVVWCCDEKLLDARRPQDSSFHGNIVEAIKAHAVKHSLSLISHMIVIGSDKMMAAVAHARHHELKPFLDPRHTAIGSINSPMQCMMKEICAQCLQKHVDPVTGKETYVYSCFNQDQSLDMVSWPHLGQRLTQQSLSEKLTARWIDHCLKALNLRSDAG
ncbi:MAG: FAD-dependent oxidoreductase [Rickettsiales bacterium]|jgi:NADPH-dependent glutamate synthase beta subunit-like oxidoreductase/NAD(P)H-flavin reductase|nr:FAD-dependent oxidoreductase [Rickettsiales bacterium]